jgi:O-antigen/teichoic acid export membrane protein
LKSPFYALFSRGIGLFLQLCMNIVLGRVLGATGMGVYSLYSAWMMVMGSIANLGMPTYTLRTVSVLDGKGLKDTARRFTLGILRTLLITGMLMIILVAGISGAVAETLLGEVGMESVLILAAVAAALFMMTKVLSESLKGIRRVNIALTSETALLPLGAIIVIGIFYLYDWNLTAKGFLVIHILLLVLTTLVMIWLMLRFARGTSKAENEEMPPLMSRSLLHFWGGGLLNMWVMNMPILLLPQFANAAEIGIFGVAYRLILLGTTILVTLASIFGPRFARDYANGDVTALKRGLRQSQLLSLIIYSPMLIAFTVFAEPVLGLFGSEFTAGKELLWIMVAGQLLNTATGLVGFMMNMIHREKQEFYIQLSVTVFVFILILILGDMYGVIGVAIAYAIGVAVKNLSSLAFSLFYLNAMEEPGRVSYEKS